MRPLHIKQPGLTKQAGTKISQSPKNWGHEALKALVDQHAYIDASQVRNKLQHIDPEEKRAFGVLIVDNRVAVPYNIRRNPQSMRVELDQLDVMFVPDPTGEDGRFQHLSKESFMQAIGQGEAGNMIGTESPMDEYDQLPPKNEYIGDLTGDVTPLEFSGYPNTLNGSGGLRTAGCGLLSKVIRDNQQLEHLYGLLGGKRGIQRGMEMVGLADSLAALEPGPEETAQTEFGDEPAVQVRKTDNGTLVVDYDNAAHPIGATELKSILQDDFEPVLQEVANRGWAMVRNFPCVRTPEVPMRTTLPSPVEQPGFYQVLGPDGERTPALVVDRKIMFDGQTLNTQFAVTPDGKWDEGKKFLGVRVEEPTDDHPARFGLPPSNEDGCFFDGQHVTPRISISTVTEAPDGTYITATRMDTLQPIGLVVLDAIVRPQSTTRHSELPDNFPDESYYLPSDMRWIKASGARADFVDAGMRDELQTQDDRPVALLRKNANYYSLEGRTLQQQIDLQMMEPSKMRYKLAALGCDDDVIEQAEHMGDQSEMALRGLRVMPYFKQARQDEGLTKVAQDLIGTIKKHAQFAMDGYDQMLEAPSEMAPGAEEEQAPGQEGFQTDPTADPQTLDAILSLQFVSDQNIREILEAEPTFKTVEDKLAKMVMAARQGEVSIDEEGAAMALEGVGRALQSIEKLKIEMESRHG